MTNKQRMEAGVPGLYAWEKPGSVKIIAADTSKGNSIIGVLAALGCYSKSDLLKMVEQDWPMWVPLENVVVGFTRHYSKPPEEADLKYALETAKNIIQNSGMNAEYIL